MLLLYIMRIKMRLETYEISLYTLELFFFFFIYVIKLLFYCFCTI